MSYFRHNDPDVDFTRLDHQQSAELNRLPRCDDCHKPIQDDYYYEVYGEILCEECMKDRYRCVND